MGSIIWILFAVIPLIIAVPLLVWMLYDGFHYVLRLIWFRFRTRLFIGGHSMVWSRITPDNTKIKQSQRTVLQASQSGSALSVNRLVEPVGFWKFWPFSTRGSVTYMWQRTEEGEINLFVGVTERHYNATTIQSLAASLDGVAVRVEAPEIPTESIAIADRGDSVMNAVGRTELSSMGDVSKAFAQSFAQSGDRRSAVFMMTMEMTPGLEKRYLRGRVVDKANEDMGMAGNFGGISNLVTNLSSNAMRVSLAVSSSGERTAGPILNNVTSSMSTLPFVANSKSFDEVSTSTTTRILGISLTAIGLISGIISAVTGNIWWPSAIALVLGVAGIVLLSSLSERVMKAPLRAFAKMGIMVLPPYLPWSSRFWLEGFRSNSLAPSSGGPKRIIGWPSPKQVFYLHPFGVMEFASFPDQVDSLGVNVTRKNYQSRGVSDSALRSVEIPMFLGQTGTDQPFFIDASTVNFSSYSAGVMGSGKTNFLEVLYSNMVRLSCDGTMNLTPIWMETKGPGAQEVWDIIGHIPGCLRVDVFSRESDFRLALEGPRVTDTGISPRAIRTNVRNLVNGFIAAWGSGIAGESKQSLISALTIAMLLSPDEIKSLQIDDVLANPERPNIPHLAWLIMRGDIYKADISERLIGIGVEHDNNDEPTDRERLLSNEITAFARYISARTWEKHAHLLNPPRNKLKDLMGVDAMWDADSRKEIYVEHIPAAFRPIVMNFGPPGDLSDIDAQEIDTASGDGFNISESKRMLIVAFWLIWNYAKSACTDWGDTNKRLVFFSDEVSDLVNRHVDETSSDALDEILKQGRGMGISVQSGSQFPDQLSHTVRQNVLTAHSKYWFRLSGADSIRIAVEDLALGDRQATPYSNENIGNNPRGVAAARVMLRQDVYSGAFTLRVPKVSDWAAKVLSPEAIQNRVSIAECAREFLNEQLIETSNRALPSAEPHPETVSVEREEHDEVMPSIYGGGYSEMDLNLSGDDTNQKRKRRKPKREKPAKNAESSNPYDLFS